MNQAQIYAKAIRENNYEESTRLMRQASRPATLLFRDGSRYSLDAEQPERCPSCSYPERPEEPKRRLAVCVECDEYGAGRAEDAAGDMVCAECRPCCPPCCCDRCKCNCHV